MEKIDNSKNRPEFFRHKYGHLTLTAIFNELSADYF